MGTRAVPAKYPSLRKDVRVPGGVLIALLGRLPQAGCRCFRNDGDSRPSHRIVGSLPVTRWLPGLIWLVAVGMFSPTVAAPLFGPGPLPLRTTPPSAEELEQGRQLASKYCAACHRFTEPHWLDRGTWHGGTEPMMRNLLGFSQLDSERAEDRALAREWTLIWDWYGHFAPIHLATSGPPLPLTLKRFEPVVLPYRMTNKMVSLVKIDATRQQLYVGNAETSTLDLLDRQGRLLGSTPVESPPVGLQERPDGWYVPLIWSLAPHTTRQGKLLRFEREGDNWVRGVEVLTGLPRPTSVAFGDLDGDGRDDIAVSGFGHVEGALSWWQRDGHRLIERVLLERPGATRVEIADLNGDGRPDLVVQMAQAQEGLYWFENQGDGRFEMRVIAEFPPVWGGSGLVVADVDADGHPDLLVTNGDSGEYASPPRPYHGLRLYRNRTKRGGGSGPSFEEVWFFPLPGAYGAKVADFDGDGDADVAVIAFFPDYAQRREGAFVVLWNEGNLKFRPETLDEGMSGRWLVMDVGDLDGDGWPDIALGAANRGAFAAPAELQKAWEERGPTVLLLRNRGP